ncbi:hypothetical protein ACFL6B_06935 [Thermodesulfobacteriota bacterium]
MFLQAISKMLLTPNDGVASLFKRLTHFHVCCAFSYVAHDACGVSRLVLERDRHF